MPERTGPLIATSVLMLIGAGVACFLQLGVLLTIGIRLNTRFVIGSLIVSAIFGGIATVVLQEYLHLQSFLAGALGTLTGMAPAALTIAAANRKALDRAGLTPAQLAEMLETIKKEAPDA